MKATPSVCLQAFRSTRVLGAVVLLALCSGAGFASEIIDQSMELDASLLAMVRQYAVGQEFTPSLSSVDFVDLHFDATSADSSAEFQVRIHEEFFDGTVVGTSLVTIVPQTVDNHDWVRLSFPASVPLTPNELYVIEVVLLNDAAFTVGFRYNTASDDYIGGSMYQGDGLWHDSDLCFREGIIPEPSSMALIAVAGLVALGRRRR